MSVVSDSGTAAATTARGGQHDSYSDMLRQLRQAPGEMMRFNHLFTRRQHASHIVRLVRLYESQRFIGSSMTSFALQPADMLRLILTTLFSQHIVHHFLPYVRACVSRC
jgi:hypothetical protein